MNLISEARERLRALFFRTREEAALDDELRFHIEMETEANLRRGMSAGEARRQAMIAFGGVERFREEVRDARGLGFLEDLWRDLRFAVRRLVREPTYSVTVIATLALGIGVVVAIFALVNAVLLRPLPYPESDRLVALRHASSRVELAATQLSRGSYAHYREHNRAFEEVGLYRGNILLTLTDRDAPELVNIALVTPSVFGVLRPRPHLGRLFTAEDAEPDAASPILISYDLWENRYGADSEIIGQTIALGRDQRVVAGVLPRGFNFPTPQTQVWYTMKVHETRASLQYLDHEGIARLKPGVSLEEADRDLDRLVRLLPETYPEVTPEALLEMGLRAEAVPFKQMIIGDVRMELWLLLATAGFVLLVAWANAANLSLVRAERQRKVVAVKRALGATEGRLASGFFSESLILAALGGTLGLASAFVAVEVRFGFEPDQIPRLREVSIGGAVLGLGLALSLLTGVLIGLVSFMHARRPNLAGALTAAIGRMTAGRTEQTGRRVLVGLQIALALTLLIGSALMAKSFWRLQKTELGFAPENVLTFHLPLLSRAYPLYQDVTRFHDELLTQLRALPGVEAAEVADILPLTDQQSDVTTKYLTAADGTDTPPEGGWPSGLFDFVTPGYFQAMGIPLRRGRTFRSEDWGPETPAVILSGALARTLFGEEDPIGRQVRWAERSGYPDYTVIGVAGDVPAAQIPDGPASLMYLPILYPLRSDSAGYEASPYKPNHASYVLRTSVPPLSLTPPVQRIVRDLDPEAPIVRVRTMEQIVSDSMARTRLLMLLLLVGAGTTLLLGVIGIYGVLSYAVRQRTSELGVRLVLGASPADVVRMVVGQGAFIALAGIAIGLLAAFALTRFLESLLYEVSPIDPLAYGLTAVLLFAVALMASYVPARRAGRIDPARALRAE